MGSFPETYNDPFWITSNGVAKCQLFSQANLASPPDFFASWHV